VNLVLHSVGQMGKEIYRFGTILVQEKLTVVSGGARRHIGLLFCATAD
jgi:hypothetical protein